MKRGAIVCLTLEALRDLLARVFELPPDCRVVGAHWSDAHDVLMVKFHGPTLPVVDECQAYPFRDLPPKG